MAIKWLTNLFSNGASKLVGEVGGIIDSLHTSKEEKMALQNDIEKAIMQNNLANLQMLADYDQQITDRHANDMQSDSWLSKNVRPLALIFLTVTAVVLAYMTIFLLSPDKVVLLEIWVALLTTLLSLVYVFYFGSRGIEKSTKMFKSKT
jgi:hypothetical protein